MRVPANDEWRIIRGLLPPGWEAAAKACGAFRRARYIKQPGEVLRLLLFHAVNDGGLRETVAQARASGIASISQVALLKRMRSSADWLAWLGAGLCESLRSGSRVPGSFRPRVIDSTAVQGPASKGTEWRIHYSLDLLTLHCDWFELTDASGAELLERTPMREGDVLLGDRNYLRPEAVTAAAKAGAHVLVRLRWAHSRMADYQGADFDALRCAKRLKVGEVGSWDVCLPGPDDSLTPGRVVAIKLPAPLARKAERRADRRSRDKGQQPDPRSLQAAHFVMLFTTLLADALSAVDVLELYRFRWQVELAFKRLKQLLRFGHLPHKDPAAAKAWILGKLVISLLLEKLYRNAHAFSPWGYDLTALPPSS